MCDICNGATYDEVLGRIDGRVSAGRWSVQGVEGDRHHRSWAYTIGLHENFGHPELVLTDGRVDDSALVLDEVAGWIAEGDRYGPGATIESDGYVLEFGAVHPSYLRHGLCAVWTEYYRWRGAEPRPLEVLQLSTRSPFTCEHLRARAHDLAVPGAFPLGAPNRAARRRAARRRP